MTEPRIEELPAEVRSKLGYYVYLYIDPTNDTPFYVGKGKGDRVLSHLDVTGECEKAKRLEDIRRSGHTPKLVIARHGMKTQKEAFAVEAALIEQIGLEYLVNKVAGHGTSEYGRMSLEKLCTRYAAEKAPAFIQPTILLKLNKTFRYAMVEEGATERDKRELFEATCGFWGVGKSNREQVKFAMAVYDGVIQEIYNVEGWQPGGTHDYEIIRVNEDHSDNWEFCGHRCEDDAIRQMYAGKSVKHLFKRGFAGSFLYGWPHKSPTTE